MVMQFKKYKDNDAQHKTTRKNFIVQHKFVTAVANQSNRHALVTGI